MADYFEAMGLKHRIKTLKDTQANGFAEAFVKVLVKLIHTTMVERTDPKWMVNRYLMVFRATPHRMTGKSSCLADKSRRNCRGCFPKPEGGKAEEQRAKQKAYADTKCGAKEKAMITTKPPLDADPWKLEGKRLPDYSNERKQGAMPRQELI